MRFRGLIIAEVVCLTGLISAADVELVPGVPIEREIAGGETHGYQVTLAAGQYLHVVVDQRGIDLQLAVFAPDGKELISINNLDAMMGPEPVSVVAETKGVYRLEVSPVNKKAVEGKYEVRIDDLRVATLQDYTRLDAQKLFTEGRKLDAQGTAESYATSLGKLEKALDLWKRVGDSWHAAVTLDEIASVDYQTGRVELAFKETLETLTLWRNLGDIRGEADALNNLGLLYFLRGDLRRALEYFSQALPLHRAIGYRDGEESTLNNIGGIYSNLGEQRQALQYYSEALATARSLALRVNEAVALDNMALVYFSLGENQKALEELGQALPLLRASGDRAGLSLCLSTLGRVYLRLGDVQKAMDYYTQALPLSREAGDPHGEALALRNLGAAYRIIGNPRKALEYVGQALATSQASKLTPVEADVRVDMGAVYSELEDKSNALSCYDQALQLYRMAGRAEGEVTVLIEAAPLYADMGNTKKAISSLERALSLSRSIQYKWGEAQALVARARVERDGGKFDVARLHLEAALPIIESARANLDSQNLRASYFASNRKTYELYIDVLMRLRKAGEALEASERARARSLLETLVETRADIRQGADPELLERERTLQQQINATERRRIDLLSKKDRAEQVTVVEKELNALLSGYQDVQARIRKTSPRYAALTQPQPLALKVIQQQVLDEDTLLLEYALGEDRSYLWAVTPASIKGFELPKRAMIETAAKRAYELLTTSHKREFQRQAELSLAGLSQMLLGPVAGQLGQKRLLIVSDGALQYIPFEALPAPGTLKAQPLVADHEIVNAPSASVLAVLRQEVAGRKPAARTVAVLSDPVFQADDPRVRRGTAPPAGNTETFGQRELTRSATDAGLARFERLPFSRKEAEAIEALASSGQVLKAVDFSASKATATSAELSQFRIVHFATHGLINSQHPELSGLVLSLVDEQGRPQDGFLRAHEIYNLKLDAELVVLSACQTALGKEVKGEGLMGLTRGFMYAGSPRLVASLWDVKDEAAAELMKRFYLGMLKESLRPAAALRAAQVSLLKEPRWRAPYYWAAFVIQGEWR